LGSDGKPTEAALKRRENQVIASYKSLTEKFFADCANVKNATANQDSALLAEIRADQKALTVTRTVSSMGDELKVSFGNYEGSRNGWNAYLSLYSDGIQLYTDSFIVNYETLSGKKAPNMETELNDSVIEEYTNNVDMYGSLLTRGDPIIYFELDYNVTAESDDKPSTYKFNFDTVRVINTVSEKTVQTSSLNKFQSRTMSPSQDLREKVAKKVAKEKEDFNRWNRIKFAKEAIGDIVYSDGSVSAKYDRTKTPIGIVIEVRNNLATRIVSLTETSANWYEAIRWCNNYMDASGYSNWDLPSKEELNQLYKVKNAVNRAIDKIIAGGGTATSLGNGRYWSSSQYNRYNAWGQRFSDGYQNDTHKNTALSVRAVRAFTP
jgi:hypothetical protein